jgi:hypothetical protein
MKQEEFDKIMEWFDDHEGISILIVVFYAAFTIIGLPVTISGLVENIISGVTMTLILSGGYLSIPAIYVINRLILAARSLPSLPENKTKRKIRRELEEKSYRRQVEFELGLPHWDEQ